MIRGQAVLLDLFKYLHKNIDETEKYPHGDKIHNYIIL